MSTFTKFAEVSKCVSSSNLFFDLHPQQRDEIQVKVVVKDIDDNSPVFLQHNTTTGVRVNAPLYTVIDTLTAVDADVDSSAVFYQVWFFIKPCSSERLPFHSFLCEAKIWSLIAFSGLGEGCEPYKQSIL